MLKLCILLWLVILVLGDSAADITTPRLQTLQDGSVCPQTTPPRLQTLQDSSVSPLTTPPRLQTLQDGSVSPLITSPCQQPLKEGSVQPTTTPSLTKDVQGGSVSPPLIKVPFGVYSYYTKKFENVFLHDHPPIVFSGTGPSSPSPSGPIPIKKIAYPAEDTHKFCQWLYRSLWNMSIAEISFSHPMINRTYTFYLDDNFNRLCLPLLRTRANCEASKYFTICYDIGIVLYNPDTCNYASESIAAYINEMYLNLVRNRSECNQYYCDGTFKASFMNVEGIDVIVYEIPRYYQYFYGQTKYNSTYCGKTFFSVNPSLHSFTNVHLVCCYHMAVVVWTQEPEKFGLNGKWSFLPLKCQVCEVLLVVLVAAVAVVGVVGNGLVMAVMATGGHLGQESSLFRTSLAVADGLRAAVVVVPSLYHHLTSILSRPIYFADIDVNKTVFSPRYQVTDGADIVQGLILDVSLMVTMLTMFLLSVERLVVSTRALKYRHYFNPALVKGAILLTWITSTLNAFIYHVDVDYGFKVDWNFSFKLPFLFSYYGINRWPEFAIQINIILLTLAGLVTVICSVTALGCTVWGQVKKRAKWRALGMIASSSLRREDHDILISHIIIISFYLISVVPLAAMILLFMAAEQHGYIPSELAYYLAVWSFVASCAWNPWIYNIRSKQFRKEVTVRITRVRDLLVRMWCDERVRSGH